MSGRSTQLSRTVAYALRHRPDSFGLVPNDAGWVTIDDLVAALWRHDPKWRDLRAGDIRAMAAANAKERFDFAEDRIRALYGHSLPDRIEMSPAEPPEILFHGTTRAALPSIRKIGLRPMQRQYVHLSPDVASATEVGLRRTREPVILGVLAGEAARGGSEFYRRNEHVWLSNSLSPDYLEFPESFSNAAK